MSRKGLSISFRPRLHKLQGKSFCLNTHRFQSVHISIHMIRMVGVKKAKLRIQKCCQEWTVLKTMRFQTKSYPWKRMTCLHLQIIASMIGVLSRAVLPSFRQSLNICSLMSSAIVERTVDTSHVIENKEKLEVVFKQLPKSNEKC